MFWSARMIANPESQGSIWQDVSNTDLLFRGCASAYPAHGSRKPDMDGRFPDSDGIGWSLFVSRRYSLKRNVKTKTRERGSC